MWRHTSHFESVRCLWLFYTVHLTIYYVIGSTWGSRTSSVWGHLTSFSFSRSISVLPSPGRHRRSVPTSFHNASVIMWGWLRFPGYVGYKGRTVRRIFYKNACSEGSWYSLFTAARTRPYTASMHMYHEPTSVPTALFRSRFGVRYFHMTRSVRVGC